MKKVGNERELMGISRKRVNEWQADFMREFGEGFGEFSIIMNFQHLRIGKLRFDFVAFNMFFFAKAMYFYVPYIQFMKYLRISFTPRSSMVPTYCFTVRSFKTNRQK